MPEPAATHPASVARSSAGPPRSRSLRPGWAIRRFEEIDSTNRYLLDEARAGGPHGLVAVADHQTAGRGRLGRSWAEVPGSALLVSVLLRPEVPPPRLGLVPMAAALALVDALRQVAGIEARGKWPNDLVVHDRKLAGVLSETDVAGGEVRALVVGVGCNLTADAVPPELADVATACAVEAGAPIARDALLDAYLDAFATRLADLDDVLASARKVSATLGRRVAVERMPAHRVVGNALDLTETGALVVRDDAGDEHTIAAGDVVHLRLDDPRASED